MIYVEGIPGRTTEIQGNSYLFFSGFGYLGMPSLPEFQQLLGDGIRKYGAVFPSSRASNTRYGLFDDFEEAISEFIGLPATASFSSGYLAAQAALQFAGRQGLVFRLDNVHPSLHLDAKDSHSDTFAFIIEQVNQSDKPCSIVLESINPLSGRVTDLHWLLRLNRPVRVIIDDSHGIGMLGDSGEGIIRELPQADHLRYLICYSLSKAFSCEGGAVSGEMDDISGIKAMPPFTAATPMSPAFVYAWMNSRSLFKRQLKTLKQNIEYFATKTKDHTSMYFDRRLPICQLPIESLYEEALKYHILLSAFRYPTDKAPLTTRMVLNALHTSGDIDRLVYCVDQIGWPPKVHSG